MVSFFSTTEFWGMEEWEEENVGEGLYARTLLEENSSPLALSATHLLPVYHCPPTPDFLCHKLQISELGPQGHSLGLCHLCLYHPFLFWVFPVPACVWSP